MSEITQGWIHISNSQVTDIESLIFDFECGDSPDDEPEWLLERVHDEVIPFYKSILAALE